LEFEYSQIAIQDDPRDIDAESLQDLPVGLNDTAYKWTDLDGEGISALLPSRAAAGCINAISVRTIKCQKMGKPARLPDLAHGSAF
jgi:hypothetical protein